MRNKDLHQAQDEGGEPQSQARPGRFGRWGVFLTIVAAAAATVFYISNVLEVNHLLKENNRLSKQYDSLINTNKALKSELNKYLSADWITRIARDSLGMEKPRSAPDVLP